MEIEELIKTARAFASTANKIWNDAFDDTDLKRAAIAANISQAFSQLATAKMMLNKED